jgi:hypothetical protein
MRPLTSRLVLCAPLLGCLLVGWSGATAAAQVGLPTATPAFPTITLPRGVLSPTPLAPGVAPRSTTGPTLTRGNVEATQTAAIATIAAADATATARAAQPLTAVAGTATLLAQPPPPPTASLTLIASVTPIATSTAPPASITLAATPTVATPTATASPLVESTTTIAAPLNAVLPQDGSIGDQSYPAGTALVLPAGTVVQGRPEPGATVELRPGTVVQVAGRMQTLVEPLVVVVGSAPVAQPATLPRTGDAAPVLWPTGLGLLLVVLGWRLRRAT